MNYSQMNYPTKKITKQARVLRNKYRAQKIVIDDMEFASKAEAAYYLTIKKEWDNGWTRQESFEIIDGFSSHGKRYSHATYRPDFIHRTNNMIDKVVDVKGGNITLTTDARLRMKLFTQRYDVQITIATYNYKTRSFYEKLY